MNRCTAIFLSIALLSCTEPTFPTAGPREPKPPIDYAKFSVALERAYENQSLLELDRLLEFWRRSIPVDEVGDGTPEFAEAVAIYKIMLDPANAERIYGGSAKPDDRAPYFITQPWIPYSSPESERPDPRQARRRSPFCPDLKRPGQKTLCLTDEMVDLLEAFLNGRRYPPGQGIPYSSDFDESRRRMEFLNERLAIALESRPWLLTRPRIISITFESPTKASAYYWFVHDGGGWSFEKVDGEWRLSEEAYYVVS